MTLPDIPSGRDVWGVDAQVVHELGRAVVTAGMLEGLGVAIARSCNIQEPEKLLFRNLMKKIRTWACAREERVEDHSLYDELLDWTRNAEALMEQRNAELHGVRFHVASADGWVPHHQHIRWGTRKQQDLDELRRLRTSLRASWDAGDALHQRIDPTVTPSPF